MTRGEEFERLDFQAMREKNDSLLEIFAHSDFTYESNLVPNKVRGQNEFGIMWETLKEEIEAGTQKVIYEDENQFHLHKYYKLKSTDVFYSVIQKLPLKDGKVFHEKEEWEDLNKDPSEGQPWTWEDVRWFYEMVTATEVTFAEWQTFANQKGIPTLTNSSIDNEWKWNLS